jgi:hypothetical protein
MPLAFVSYPQLGYEWESHITTVEREGGPEGEKEGGKEKIGVQGESRGRMDEGGGLKEGGGGGWRRRVRALRGGRARMERASGGHFTRQAKSSRGRTKMEARERGSERRWVQEEGARENSLKRSPRHLERTMTPIRGIRARFSYSHRDHDVLYEQQSDLRSFCEDVGRTSTFSTSLIRRSCWTVMEDEAYFTP